MMCATGHTQSTRTSFGSSYSIINAHEPIDAQPRLRHLYRSSLFEAAHTRRFQAPRSAAGPHLGLPYDISHLQVLLGIVI